MIKYINFLGRKIPIDRTMNMSTLKSRFIGSNNDMEILGAYDPNDEKIYIAKFLTTKQSYRTLLHECIELINSMCEIGIDDNHVKIVSLENAFLSLILDNKDFIKALYKAFEMKETGKRKKKKRIKNDGTDNKDSCST